ncbi:LPS export ABC transporter periplasmic protein LptC [Pseudoalteromonas piratica]|jgi:lipopolysaccharide export system protein LptC|uniref:Lipopolysaccharide export system protein LptC n=1 Tax=Pseudoalteromonas piratica TaxID=1348114 RepID=A0A0A7EC12_9GAMM|nr:LPS export ABC transporter periplasmic protein LptC [Pseudoalteromonas piratica]AIY64058.1 lipopolysaccharide export system protein LptC [Pseudoalteromonas piratica]
MSARIALSILFTIAMLWLWLPYFFAPKEQIQIVKPITNIPDYIATDLKQTYFSDLGTVSHKVTAEKMSMYQELGFTHFVKPQFTIFSEQGVWQLKAEEATLYDNEKLILEQNVIAKSLTTDVMLDTIEAASIEYFISTKIMTSDSEVKMTGPGLEIKGQGLNANLEEQVINLINHTKTTYYDQ